MDDAPRLDLTRALLEFAFLEHLRTLTELEAVAKVQVDD